ncbi:hypothetical protein RH858_10425 [Halalkaliarchaeum sp. AArc-GB]|uniref:hypothetical protein n=1 Tax=Halalkaliarchaeum sp. AArc-GB TaxID=3074078 RepID=UPI002857A46D|nr:hypothetical protein [Halalkaliarchaeum sp. AArc-GB]MDR5673553.1 hypothetical protein [Halalkaliarchaeum sp. AArc-GB]
MVKVRFGDVSTLYWQVNRAKDAGRSPPVDTIKNALRQREITTFLDQYNEVDLSLYGSDPFCTQDELDALLEQWTVAEAKDLSLSSDANGLDYLASVIVEVLKGGNWKEKNGRSVDVRDLVMDAPV